MAKRKKKYDDDDGRVIANMNVEGMPWYQSGSTPTSSDRGGNGERQVKRHENTPDDLTHEDMRAIYAGSMKAGCLVALICCAIVVIAGLIAYIALGGWNM